MEWATALASAHLNNFDKLIDLLPAAAYLCESPTGIIKRYNQRSAELWGRQPQYGDPAERFCGAVRRYYPDGTLMPPEQSPMAATLRNGTALHDQEVMLERPDGSCISALFNVAPLKDETGEVIAAVNIFQNISKLKRTEAALQRTEERLRHSQKMEAMGRLAGGVAHDFNNLLTAIMGQSELMVRRLRQGDPLCRNIEQIRRATDRAASLTAQLLAFSRKQVMQPKVLDLGAVIMDMEQMLGRLINENIELITILEPAAGWVKVDPSQIEQVIMNLVLNARDVMPRGGKLTIETKAVELDDAYASQHISVRPGRYVMLAVSDTGKGMDKETESRLFEPFFTTKEPGKGTGLGLSTSYGIVKQSGGNIWAYSEVGRGTTFKVYLPQVEEAVAERLNGAASAAEVPGGTETILLVEDEDMIRETTREIIEMNGYKVLEARHGGEALLISERYEDLIDLMVTDVVMPQMSGPELAERLAGLRPEMRVIYMSGYTENAIVHHDGWSGEVAFLQKPFTRDALAHKIRDVLDAPRSRSAQAS